MPTPNYDPILNTDALWRLMKRHGYTPETLSAELGVSMRTMGSWLTGAVQPRPVALYALARILDVPNSALQKQRGL